jgi:F-type H+-transporting ATPase subunit delta
MSRLGGALARIYAAALFELAREREELAERREEVTVLLQALREDIGFQQVIASPMVEAARKSALVRGVFADRFSRDLRNLVLLLIEKNRQAALPSILEAFLEICDEEEGDLPARVTTAVPLEREEAENLARGLSESVGKKVVLEESTDKTLLGGAVLRFGDFLVDGSLRTRIRELREKLVVSSET